MIPPDPTTIAGPAAGRCAIRARAAVSMCAALTASTTKAPPGCADELPPQFVEGAVAVGGQVQTVRQRTVASWVASTRRKSDSVIGVDG